MAIPDLTDYVRRVLGPAVERFKSDGVLPDLFERYALPLEVTSPGDINAAVVEVKALWDKTRLSNPKYAAFIGKLVADHAEATRQLLDDRARSAARAIAEQERSERRERRFKAVVEAIRIIAGKGFITHQERATLVARFARDGVTEADVTSRILVDVREPRRYLPTDPAFPKEIRDAARASLAVLGLRDLYEFLDVSRGAGPEEIKRRCREVEDANRTLKVDHRLTARQTLIGIASSYLVPEKERARYDAALAYETVERLRPHVELAASGKRISHETFQALVDIATGRECGLDEEHARGYVLELAEQLGAAVEYQGTSGDSIRCARCSTLLPRDARLDKCTTCGADVWRTCPRCAAALARSEDACGRCGFRPADHARVQLLLRQAELALEEGRIADAAERARAAVALWGRDGDAGKIAQAVESRVRDLEAARANADAALRARRLHEARAILAPLAGATAYVFRDGRASSDLLRDLDADLSRVRAAVERGREAERRGRHEEAVFAYEDALRIAADAEDARRGLLRCPPAPPRDVRAELRGGDVVVGWAPTPSRGELEYVVVRRADRAPESPGDGDTVARGREPRCVDGSAPTGALAWYAVFVVRHGAWARAEVPMPVLVAREVERLDLEPGDGTVSGAWAGAPGRGTVRIRRRQGMAPTGPNDGVGVPLAGPSSFVDGSLENGVTYHYLVFVEYRDGTGRVVATAGVRATARPDRPPDAVEQLEFARTDVGLQVRWPAPARGAVVVYKAPGEPPWPVGTLVPLSRLGELGTALANAGSDCARDPAPGEAALYVPVAIAGGLAVVGRGRRYVAVPDVTGLEARDLGSALTLHWEWPRGCTAALVAWRSDTFPTGPADPRATTRRVTLGEYGQASGFRLDRPAAIPYRFTVFAAARAETEEAFASGCTAGARAELRLRPAVTVRYAVERGTLRRSRGTLTVRCSEAVQRLPELVLVARRGEVQPLRPEDGVPLAVVRGACIAAGGDVTQEFRIDRVPVYLRAFFRDPAEAAGYCLVDPPPSQLKVT